ncbi:zinc ribbon domain-containing protein [Halostella litorea]|uniref:zinc ribbon domain-containing protein n=1 Tax=Halostella litorea TaxID=2528831 RepID=UPI001092CDD3|nr:zinc ribbon domain-containing protein [Halostella litorea]
MPSEDGCPKCGHGEADVDTISTTGGGLSKMFDIQNRKFEVVSCAKCGYSELYRADRSGASDVVDVFFG